MTAERRKMSRSRILTGATDILDAGVYGDLTVDALARGLHMSKSTLYKYFASKEDVVVALVDQACTQTDKDLDTLDVHGLSVRNALKKLLEIFAQHAERMPRAAILQSARLPDACQDRLEVTRARVGAAFRDVLVRGAQHGEVAFADVNLAATALVASVEAATIAAARGDVTSSRADTVRNLLDLFAPGLVQTLAMAS